MNTTSKGKNQDKVRQLTAAERAALDEEATTCAAEVVGVADPAGSGSATGSGVGGKVKRLAARVTGAARRAKTWARDRMAPENVDAALSTSKSYAVLAAKYGADVAREAVMRRVRAAIERKICGAVAGPGSGPGGFTDPGKSAQTRG